MVDQLHILDTITMAPWVDHPHQDSNQTTQVVDAKWRRAEM